VHDLHKRRSGIAPSPRHVRQVSLLPARIALSYLTDLGSGPYFVMVTVPAVGRGWAVSRTRLRSSGSPARPNIWRLIILMWLTRPSTGPEFQRVVQALGDGAEVLGESFGEGGQAGQVGGLSVADPLREVLAGELGEHPRECADLGVGGPELGAAF
jgi:hypothetical protein